MALIKRKERDAHWYTKTGEAAHEQIAKSSGLPRATTVTDARKLGLLPSVTNIIGVKAKPGLDVWKLDKAILSALSLKQIPGEPDETFHSRIAEDANKEVSYAAEWGTLIHEQCEQYNTTGAFLGTGEILHYVAGYADWFRENVVEVLTVERSLVSPYGYAGRLDLTAMIRHNGGIRKATIDIKSQRLKGKAKGNFYSEWLIQLAAYGDVDRDEEGNLPLLVSLLIPSDSPGPVQAKHWDDGERGMMAFKACYDLWVFEKNYDPRTT